MKIRKSDLRELIRELFEPTEKDFENVKKKGVKGLFKLSDKYSEEEKKDYLRTIGLQSVEDIKLDRKNLQDYQSKIDKKNFLKKINNGDITILHSITYASRTAGAAPADAGTFNVLEWFDKYAKSGKNILSAVMFPVPIEEISADGFHATQSNAQEKARNWEDRWVQNWLKTEYYPFLNEMKSLRLGLLDEIDSIELEMSNLESIDMGEDFDYVSKYDRPEYKELESYNKLTRDTLSDVNREIEQYTLADPELAAREQTEFLELKNRIDPNAGNVMRMRDAIGIVLKGYPVFVGQEDLGSQTITALPDRLKKHQQQSGIAKRPALDKKGLYSPFELELAGHSDETLIDNWKPVGIYGTVGGGLDPSNVDKITSEDLKNTSSNLHTHATALVASKKYGVPIYYL
jgi:hypothetical protein